MIPKKVRICGLDYKVEIDNDMHRDNGFQGLHDAKKLIIKLQKDGYSDDKVFQTFIHEVTHAINYHYNNDELSEEQVDRMANGFHAFLKDNKEVR